MGVRNRLYRLLEEDGGIGIGSQIVDAVLVVVILANVTGFVLETVPSITTAWAQELRWLEIGSVGIFTVEYLARLWCSPEVPFLKRMPAWRARMAFAGRAPMLIDLLSILPTYLSMFVPLDLRILRVFRLFRFLKLNRYSPAMHTLTRVLANERRALAGALMLVLVALLFAASGMYLIESTAQPNAFGSIPQSAWWAIVTLTTVGYGDVYPITAFGKVFAGVVMLCGLIVLALPIAIISTGFAQEVNRRDFVLTWTMLARIPLFAELDANAVASLLGLLKAQNLPPDREVSAVSDAGRSMFFVASGHVTDADGRAEYRDGDFFGEHAILGINRPSMAYITRGRTRLLELSQADFQKLQAHHPEVCQQIRALGEARWRDVSGV
jgi:voltage-gated potassium channel